MLRRIVIIALVLSLIGLAAGFVAQSIYRSDKDKLSILVLPDNASIAVNGVDVGMKHELYLERNQKYALTISREGFSDEYRYIDTSDEFAPSEIRVSLKAESDEAKKWVANNQAKYVEFNNLVSESLKEQQKRLVDRYPLIANLPHRNYLFSIGYIENRDQTAVITVHTSDSYVVNAITQIKLWGYNPAEYDIRFIEQEDRFDEQ